MRFSLRDPRNRRAFSLVEVVLAVGIVSLVLLPVFALLPVGLRANRESQDETAAAAVLGIVINDRMCTPAAQPSVTYNLSALLPAMGMTTNGPLYLDENGAVTTQAKSLYQVKVVFTPPPPSSLAPYSMYCVVSWPAQSATPPEHIETLAAIPQTTPTTP